MKLALHVIFAAAYGYEFDWDSIDERWTGHQMGIKAAIRLLIDELRMFVVLPTPLLKILPFEYARNVVQSYDETKQYFRELIQLEKSGGTTNTARRTVLSSLVEKSADGTTSKKGDTFTETEILGNIFFFLLAGHETTYCLLPLSTTKIVPMSSCMPSILWPSTLPFKTHSMKNSLVSVAPANPLSKTSRPI